MPYVRLQFRSAEIDFRLVLAVYAVVLIGVALFIPLWLNEILVLAGTTQHSWAALFGWVAATPAAAPLFYVIQKPFVALFGTHNVAARLPTLVFALASAWQFFRVAKHIPLRMPYVALAIFLLLPLQFR